MNNNNGNNNNKPFAQTPHTYAVGRDLETGVSEGSIIIKRLTPLWWHYRIKVPLFDDGRERILINAVEECEKLQTRRQRRFATAC
jgi:hypothetical protein